MNHVEAKILEDVKAHLSAWVTGVENHVKATKATAAAGAGAAAAAANVKGSALERVTPLTFRVMARTGNHV